jgi:hypothetical protein
MRTDDHVGGARDQPGALDVADEVQRPARKLLVGGDHVGCPLGRLLAV